jgi:hypothetical protein
MGTCSHFNYLDIVEIERGCFNFSGVRLGCVLHVEDGLLPELSVVVEAKFGISSVDHALGGLGQRVYFQLKAIHVDEELVQSFDLLCQRKKNLKHALDLT